MYEATAGPDLIADTAENICNDRSQSRPSVLREAIASHGPSQLDRPSASHRFVVDLRLEPEKCANSQFSSNERHMKWFKAGRHLANGDRARDNRDWVTAARHYERFLRRRPRNAAIWVQLGHMHKECGHFASAATAYQTALNLAPNEADTHFQVGQLNKQLGNMQQALLAFRRALAIDSNLDAAQREIRQLGDNMPPSGDAEELKSLKKQVQTLSSRLRLMEEALAELASGRDVKSKPKPYPATPR